MNDVRICAVVTGKTMEEFLENLEKIQREADLVELRVDYIDNFSVNDIDLIKSKTKKQVIFTCRKKEEGGFFTGSESERMEILRKAIKAGFDYVDVELATVLLNPSLPPLIRGGGKTLVILSFHDFEKTPKLSELEEIKSRMKQNHVDIMKFATMVKDDGDIKVLFQFLLNKQEDEKMIVIGMGEKGKMTRFVAPLLGSYLTYVSTEYSESAEGQMEIGDLRRVYDIIGNRE